MSHFIITAIVVLAAAKAKAQIKAQIKDNLTNPKGGEKFEGNREVVT